jgi:hypothetical protein
MMEIKVDNGHNRDDELVYEERGSFPRAERAHR